MSSQRRVWIRCNGMSCGETYAEEDKFERVGEVRARARKEGWSTRGGGGLLPGVHAHPGHAVLPLPPWASEDLTMQLDLFAPPPEPIRLPVAPRPAPEPEPTPAPPEPPPERHPKDCPACGREQSGDLVSCTSLRDDGTLDMFHLVTRFRCLRCDHRWAVSKVRTDVCTHGLLLRVPCAACDRTWAMIDGSTG